MSTLREECKERLKVAFDQVRGVSGALTFILIVDDIALKVLSNTIKMMQLINYGITSVERLELKRKKFHKIQAVYLIHPDSYQALLDDYSVAGEPQYHTIHVLTLTKIPMKVMSEFSETPEFYKRVKSLKEINMNFTLHNHNEFRICQQEQDTFGKIAHGEGFDYQKIVDRTIEELSTVVTSFSSFFIVEILYSKPTSSNLSEKIAKGVKERLEGMFKNFDKMQTNNYSNGSPQTTLLILDRSFDAVSPLMRDFHYMPLLYQVRKVRDHKLKDKKDKVYNLADGDDIFEKYRYEHIAKAIQGIPTDFEDFSHNHVAAKFEKGQKQGNMDNMAEVMKKIPQYTQSKDKYSLHLRLIEEINDRYQKDNQRKIGQLQQTITTLTNEQGKKVKPDELLNRTLQTLKDIKDTEEAARILSIALMSIDLKPKEKTLLINECEKLSNFESIHKKLVYLTGHGLCTLNPRKDRASNKQESLILDKYVPRLEQIVKDVANGGQADLGFLRVGSDTRTQKSNFKATGTLGRKKIGMNAQETAKPRLIVFITSAIGYNEIRCISQYADQFHLIVGSHDFVTPNEYLTQINDL